MAKIILVDGCSETSLHMQSMFETHTKHEVIKISFFSEAKKFLEKNPEGISLVIIRFNWDFMVFLKRKNEKAVTRVPVVVILSKNPGENDSVKVLGGDASIKGVLGYNDFIKMLTLIK